MGQSLGCEAANSQSTHTSPGCWSCSITNPEKAIDHSVASASTLQILHGNADAFVSQDLRFPNDGNPGDSVEIKLSFSSPITNINSISNVQIASFDGVSYNGDRISVKAPAILLKWLSPSEALVGFRALHHFDRIEVRLTDGSSGKVSKVNVHYARKPTPLPLVLQDTIRVCYGQSATFTAIGGQGITFKWYKYPTGGSVLHIGSTFITPGIITSSVYYVQAFRNGCASAIRVPVYAFPLQGTVKRWDKTFGGSQEETFQSIIRTINNDGYLLGGSTYSSDGDVNSLVIPGSFGDDFWLVKSDIFGNKQWEKTYGGSFDDRLFSIVKTTDGGYLLGGASGSVDGDVTDPNNGGDDMWIVKIDSLGNKLWDKAYGGSGTEVLFSMINTPDGGYLLGGFSVSSDGDITDGNNGNADMAIIKIDSIGNKQWDKTFGGSGNDNIYSVMLTPDGGYLLSGILAGVSSEIIKTDAWGNQLWSKPLLNMGGALAFDICQSLGGGYLLAGYAAVSGNHDDMWVARIDENGNNLWSKTYGGTWIEQANSVVQDSEGNYFLIGVVSSDDGDITDELKGMADSWLVKIDSVGNKLWDKVYGGTNDDYLSLIEPAIDGGYILGGPTYSNDFDITDGNNGGADFWIVKVDECSDNNLRQASQLSFESTEENTSVHNNITAYPNPFSGIVSFEILAENSGQAMFEFYTAEGILVKSFKSDVGEGEQTILFETKDLQAGSYICKISVDNKVIVKKLVKL
ncbi:MAG: T9SS type A sorting domain-containing protein [Sporocytophaga sp.]|uniref:Ig-like domain-containing protein n=1 Tax=Sporocytophaga sp. TaxID=2231183 RepID=UPI001B07458D|nr:T9SS type A sorting domain-containing protein [Sporocytophaga sp.]MBO9702848.1 T9SS type A sorting domain-containing protein [Sporocytophaga sp.]